MLYEIRLVAYYTDVPIHSEVGERSAPNATYGGGAILSAFLATPMEEAAYGGGAVLSAFLATITLVFSAQVGERDISIFFTRNKLHVAIINAAEINTELVVTVLRQTVARKIIIS